MAESQPTATTYENGNGLSYPLTKMNFLVSVNGIQGTAAFSEVTGVEASVDVIEFRQGNAHSLAPVKIPGLVKHGNVTLKFGYTLDSAFKTWIQECVSEVRGQMPRNNVQIELIDINGGAPNQAVTAVTGTRVWLLTNAWVAKYSGADLNASTSEVAIESVELAYEELVIPN
ncbi:MAG: phage tail protein [Lachnospiraceae bacterium]|nr:phage tail protein [Lachnospiraceae bacterium]